MVGFGSDEEEDSPSIMTVRGVVVVTIGVVLDRLTSSALSSSRTFSGGGGLMRDTAHVM